MGYTRRHSPHFRLAPFALRTTGFLQTGQTSMSSKSCEIIEAPLYSEPCTANRVAREFSPVSVGWLNLWFSAFQDLLLSSLCDRIAFRFTARPARWDGSQDSRRYQNSC